MAVLPSSDDFNVRCENAAELYQFRPWQVITDRPAIQIKDQLCHAV